MNKEDLEQISDSIDRKDVILLLSKAENLEKAKIELLRKFQKEEDSSVVYVTITRPYDKVTEILESKDIKTDQIFFIDCMTKASGGTEGSRVKNCVYVNPENLTNISIAVSEAVENLPDDNDKLLIFDTLSALSIHNDDEPLNQFAAFLTGKIRGWDIKSVILTIEEELSDETLAHLSQCVDCKMDLDD